MSELTFNRRQIIASLIIGSAAIAAPFSSISCVGSTTFKAGDDLLSFIDSNGKKQPVRTAADWAIKRGQILSGLQEALGPLPASDGLPPSDLETIVAITEEKYRRLTIRFSVAGNEKIIANLYLPNTGSKNNRLPAMLALHETDAIGKLSVDGQGRNKNLAYAKELAERGYVVIAPDYPGFGDLKEYAFQHAGYQSGMMKSIFDDMRCVDLLQARADVDPNRIGVIGHSLGGHSALFAAAFDTRLKVVVSSCGWTPFDFYDAGEKVSAAYGGRLGPWAQDRYMPLLRTKFQLDPQKIPFDFNEVIAAIAPRAFFSNSPLNDSNFSAAGVRKGISDVIPVYRLLKADDKLQVRYPDSAHDFPEPVRMEAYAFIGKVLGAT